MTAHVRAEDLRPFGLKGDSLGHAGLPGLSCVTCGSNRYAIESRRALRRLASQWGRGIAYLPKPHPWAYPLPVARLEPARRAR